MEKAQKLLESAVVCPLPVPALNKWTRLGPTIARVTFMSHFCGVLGHCLRKEFATLAERVQEEDHGSDREAEDAAASVGLPLDERAEWRRVANQRRVKAFEFVEDREAAFYNLLWLVIASPILVLHWKLFKHAKWASERDAGAEEGRIVREFCDPALNPAAAVIDALFQILADSAQALRVLFTFHGSLTQWSGARKAAVQQLVLLAAGQLWRKLVVPWRSFPWRLWPLAFCEDEGERRSAAEELLAQRECCLDECFSRKLSKLAPSPDYLLEDCTQSFVQTCFTRAVATSTFVERRFASYGAWVARRGSAPRLPTLAGKHVTSCVKDFVAHWRGSRNVGRADGSRARPAWVADRALKRTTGLHVYTREQAQTRGSDASGGSPAKLTNFIKTTNEAWGALSAAERAAYRQRAKEQNAASAAQNIARAQVANCHGGPWHVADLRGRWPMRLEVLEAAAAGKPYKELSAAWVAAHREPEEERANITLRGEADVHLFGQCPFRGCAAQLNDAQQAALRRLQANVALLVRAEYPPPGKVGAGMLLLRFRSQSRGAERILDFAVCFATRTRPPESVMLPLRASLEQSGCVPADLRLPSSLDRSCGDDSFCTDAMLCVRLVRLSTEWCISVLKSQAPADKLDFVRVTSEQRHSQEDLDEMRRQLLLQDAALRAAKRAQSTVQRKPKPQAKKSAGAGSRERSRTQSRRKSKTRKQDSPERGTDVELLSQCSQSDESATWSDFSEEDLPAALAQLRTSVPSSSSAAPPRSEAPPLPMPMPSSRAGGSRPGRVLRHRGQQWGPFTISPIVRARDGPGVSGYGAICGLHTDRALEGESVTQTACKKSFACGGTRSGQECVVLLKRWLLRGILQQAEWPLHRLRHAHVRMPAHELANGPTEAEMDAWMEDFMRRQAPAASG